MRIMQNNAELVDDETNSLETLNAVQFRLKSHQTFRVIRMLRYQLVTKIRN